MTERWWAPSRATVEPDAVVKVLLAPSGDAVGDLGATLLAVHRAGASACEVVSKGAVPSEMGLVAKMADARALIADLVVDAASASMDANYALFFVRDFFDDAEEGALTLYRTAVAKGVSPPVAAGRAGAVYGLPYKQMGQYAAMANDPKINPVSLTDAADRALLGFISKMVKLEVEVPKEEVSKATATLERPRTQTRTTMEWDSREHPRDGGGRFSETSTGFEDPGAIARARTTTGLGLQAAPDVDFSLDTEEHTYPVTAPTKGSLRPTRRVRTTRATRRTVTAAQVAETKAQVAPKSATTTSIQARKIRAKRIQAHKITARSNIGTVADQEPEGSTGFPLMGRQETDESFYRDINETLSFITVSGTANEFIKGLNTPVDKRIFRLGHIDRFFGEPVRSAVETKEQHADAVDEIASYAKIVTDGVPEPEVHELYDISTAQHAGMTDLQFTQRMRQILSNGDPTEEQNMIEATDYKDGSTKLLVWLNQVPGAAKADLRPQPTLMEFYTKRGLSGYIDQGHDSDTQRAIAVNPNQPFKVGPLEKYWDSDHQVFINRYEILPIEEAEVEEIMSTKPFHKALEVSERVHFNQEHPRDQGGQFTTTLERPSGVAPSVRPEASQRTMIRPDTVRQLVRPSESEEVETYLTGIAQPGRPVRRIRNTRRTRRVVTQQPQFDTEVGLDQQQADKPKARNIMARRIQPSRLRAKIIQAIKLPTDPDLVLNENNSYKVISAKDFTDLIARTAHGKPALDPFHTEATLSNKGSDILLNQYDAIPASETMNELGSHFLANAKSLKVKTKIPFSISNDPGYKERDEDALIEKIKELFDRNPNLDYIRVALDPAKKPDESTHYLIWGNRDESRMEPVYLIEMDNDIDWDRQNVDLVFQKQYSALNVTAENPADSAGAVYEGYKADKVFGVGASEDEDGELDDLGIHNAKFFNSKVEVFRAKVRKVQASGEN